MSRSVACLVFMILLTVLVLSGLAGCGAGDDDDDNDSATDEDDNDDNGAGDDDNDTGTDDDNDDTDTDDDDDNDDDDDDDDDYPDDYLAPWPQSNIETQDYDESVPGGSLRIKAEDYNQFYIDWHQPYYGGNVGKVIFTDETRTAVQNYNDYVDSTIWTGTYLVSQAMRYYVTGEQAAKDNAIQMVEVLDRHLQVTGRPGFIGRYTAPQDSLIYIGNGGDAWCDAQSDCHRIETGPYAGDWWRGKTSRDQYTGWFFGMVTAYDLIDDEDTKDLIVADVTAVLDELIDNYWLIIDVNGLPSLSTPNVGIMNVICWSLIGYHITGEERYKEEVQKIILDSKRNWIRTANTVFLQQYGGYFPNNLRHQTQYTLLRLAKVYFSPDDYNFFLDLFETQTHSFTRLSHNAFFNVIFMSQGDYTPEQTDDPYQAQLEEDLTDFRSPPNTYYYVDPPDGTLDPLSVFLHDLIVTYPWVEYLTGNVKYQSQDPHPVLEQCSTDFLWQRNPFVIEPCGQDAPNLTRPGIDYMVAYWMAAYHKFITKDY